MKKSFWMFFVLLLIITVISSLGGGIRYRENFLEEVFDINDALESVVGELSDFPKYFYPVNEEKVNPVVEEELNPQKKTKPLIKESDMPSVLNIPTPPPKKTVAFDVSATKQVNYVEPNVNYDTLVEGFSGDMYAIPF